MSGRGAGMDGFVRRTVLGALGAGALAPALAAAGPARFAVVGDRFLLDGRPFQIRSGEMHYPRVPRGVWRDRMRKLRALGLNTVSTYVFWNAHEPSRGRFDFSGQLDVASYVRTAQEEGLFVLLRAGPYICGEWDGGGLPAWLYATPGFRPRVNSAVYLDPAARWLRRLGRELAPLEIDRGGPILMTQVENEYGSYGRDAAYMGASRRLVREAGFAGLLYTADGAAVADAGMLPDTVAGIDFAATDDAAREFAIFAAKRPGAPRFCSEIWTGWFDHFGETHQSVPVAPLVKNLEWMVARGISFNLYMVHGGTSFGFDAGANQDAKGYRADVSSYDYDALLDEAGRPTPKYFGVREVLARDAPGVLPPLPAPEPCVVIPRFDLVERAPLSQLHGPARREEQPLAFAAAGLAHGLMLYRTPLPAGGRHDFAAAGLSDLAQVRVGGRLQGAVDRRLGDAPRLPVEGEAGETLEVLVAAFGQVNYGADVGLDPKGLLGPATLAGAPLAGWDHIALPLDDLSRLTFTPSPGRDGEAGPAFHRGVFQIVQPGYAFFDLRGWGRGYVWLNGRNLGRYDALGPQRRLFAPAEAMRSGVNTLIVLDLEAGGERTVAAAADPLWDVAVSVESPS